MREGGRERAPPAGLVASSRFVQAFGTQRAHGNGSAETRSCLPLPSPPLPPRNGPTPAADDDQVRT